MIKTFFIVFILNCHTITFDHFRDNKVYIILAAYEQYKLMYDVAEINDPPFVIWSDIYKNARRIHDDISKVTKSGDLYKIKIGPKYLCYDNKKIIMCNDNKPDLWKIDKANFGYTISAKNYCVTASNTKLYLEACKNNKDQIFDFIIVPKILECLDQISFSKNTKARDEKIIKQIKKQLKNIDLELVKNKIADKLQIGDLKTIEQKPNETEFEKYLDKTIPDIKKNNKLKKILDKLWKHDFGLSYWKKAWNAFKDFFCS